MDPRHESTKSAFAAAQAAPPESPRPSTGVKSQAIPIPDPFRLTLQAANGAEIGELGVNDSGWCIIVPRGQGTKLKMYLYGNNWYIRKADDLSSYLSVSNNAYAGFYGWSGASPMTLTDKLRCAYNNQNLSFYSTDNGYLYFWDQYTVLNVSPVAVSAVKAA
jgi:hypothetical protein